MLKVGQRVPHSPAAQAGVVRHALPDEHRALIEQLRVARCVEPAARLVIANRVGLEPRALALDVRLATQEDHLAVAHDDERVGHVVGDLEALEFEQRVHHGIGLGKRTGGAGRQSALACGRGVYAAATAVRLSPGWLDDRRRVPPRRWWWRILRVQRRPAQAKDEHHHGRRRDPPRAPAARDPRAPDAELVQEQQRSQHQHHRHRIGRREESRQEGGDHDGVAPLPSQKLRGHDAQRRQDRHDQRQLGHEPAAHDERYRHAEVAVDGDHRGQIGALETEQHLERGRQQPLVARNRPGEKQHDADGEGGNDEPPLALVERRRQERPDLIDDDRGRHDTAQRERHFQREHERLGGARENEAATGQIRRDGPLQDVDDVDLVEQNPTEDRPHHDRDEAPEDAPTQLLEMVEKRHLTAWRHRWWYGQEVTA